MNEKRKNRILRHLYPALKYSPCKNNCDTFAIIIFNVDVYVRIVYKDSYATLFSVATVTCLNLKVVNFFDVFEPHFSAYRMWNLSLFSLSTVLIVIH